MRAARFLLALVRLPALLVLHFGRADDRVKALCIARSARLPGITPRDYYRLLGQAMALEIEAGAEGIAEAEACGEALWAGLVQRLNDARRLAIVTTLYRSLLEDMNERARLENMETKGGVQ